MPKQLRSKKTGNRVKLSVKRKIKKPIRTRGNIRRKA